MVARINGSLPLLVWIQAFTQPARTRCGVTRHQALAMHHWRADGSNSSAAALTASPAPVVTASAIRPTSLAMSPEGTARAARMPSSQRQFQVSSASPGRRTPVTAASRLDSTLGSFGPCRRPAAIRGRRRTGSRAALGYCGTGSSQLHAELVAADRGVVRQYVEPLVPVLVEKPAAALGDLPVPPAGFGVTNRVQPCPRAAGQADEPGDADPAGVTYGAGDLGDDAAA